MDENLLYSSTRSLPCPVSLCFRLFPGRALPPFSPWTQAPSTLSSIPIQEVIIFFLEKGPCPTETHMPGQGTFWKRPVWTRDEWALPQCSRWPRASGLSHDTQESRPDNQVNKTESYTLRQTYRDTQKFLRNYKKLSYIQGWYNSTNFSRSIEIFSIYHSGEEYFSYFSNCYEWSLPPSTWIIYKY